MSRPVCTGRNTGRRPGMPAAEALDTRAIDRARDVNVNGTGKILVDFKNVPNGVRTSAEGEGLFKSTEITRHRCRRRARGRASAR
jgi:hypothetical protein